MAVGNRLYPPWKQGLLATTSGYNLNIDSGNDGVFCALVDTNAYVYNDGHDFFSDLSGIVGTPQRITAPTILGGVFDGNNIVYISVVGPEVEALIVYRQNPGPNATWPLVMYYDQPGGGLPVTPNGGNITVTWNSAGIFTLGAPPP
jgi:hypothetical protein